jgi:hypothetical protein
MHTAKQRGRKLRNKKPRYGISALAATRHPPPRHHLYSKLSKSDASKKGQYTSVVVARSKDLRFHPEDSPYSRNNAFNKAIARHNQLRPDIGFSP